MKVETKWFGTIEVGEEQILTFEKGIIGFEDWKKYTLIYDAEKGVEESSIYWLQAIDEPTLALPIMDPTLVYEGYDPIVEDEIINTLGDNIADATLLVVCTVTVPEKLENMTINLKAPVIINMDTNKGVQLIADNDDYQVRYPIYDILNAEKDGE
ncbi:MAG: flagellar assembly protein FliW [Lachnospira sp.]|uniref:Flagellar assembly factor FliW n=1 Tax=Lachnospira pectinoschiza TaxID=28052 RepID=A0A1G9XMZ4_9FIRM|nr:flagellar assembly protein FliW [Lachnospira pectinoschiza]MCR5515458.1 flagellar assembly protein FliW [Lachnospira sp.]SDM97613.1 flagellar assembly factor FliW [Lachnospira pectinoschiza]